MIFPLLAAVAVAQTPFGLPQSSSNVRYDMIARGNDLATNSPGLYVFNEPVGWSNYWRANHREAGPNLEPGFFSRWRLVAIHAGVRPGPGYDLRVQRIDRRIDRAVVSALEIVPPQRRNGRGGDDGHSRRSNAPTFTTAPWILLRVERGAFDLVLQTRQIEGVPAYQTVRPGSVVKVGGATIIFTPGGYCPPR